MKTTETVVEPEVEAVVELSIADLELIGGGIANVHFC